MRVKADHMQGTLEMHLGPSLLIVDEGQAQAQAVDEHCQHDQPNISCHQQANSGGWYIPQANNQRCFVQYYCVVCTANQASQCQC